MPVTSSHIIKPQDKKYEDGLVRNIVG